MLVLLAALAGGCEFNRLPDNGDGERPVVVTVINVTPFSAHVLISGIRDGGVDTVSRAVPPSDFVDVTFTCLDEIVIGDPLDTPAAGIVILADGGEASIAAFRLLADEAFVCGDIVEVIISGHTSETFAADVFALTLPVSDGR